MPKLTIPERTYGEAIGCLIDLYKKEPGFITELQEIRGVYEPFVIKWLDSSVPQWRQLQVELIQARARKGGSTKLSDVDIKLSKKISYSIRRFYRGWNVTRELIEYEKELRDLAGRWHFRAKYSGLALILSHINDIVGIMSESDEAIIETSVEVIEPILDKPPLPPLIYKVSAYELMYSDQREIIKEFTKRLSDYEKELKSIGWKELPSAVKMHASWWFEHYVHRKPHKEIAARNPVEVTENSVRQAVLRFRSLLGIDIN